MEVFLLWVLCALRWRSPRRADHSSSEALPSVVCPMSVRQSPQGEAMTRNRAEAPQEKSIDYIKFFFSTFWRRFTCPG